MADLLECLLQIKALHETPRRLREAAERASAAAWNVRPAPGVWTPLEVAAHLADLELVFGVRLRQILTVDRPFLQPLDPDALAVRAGYAGWPLAVALERFARRRAETLELLDGCSAIDLERPGLHPRRGTMTVADTVALMLAHDIDHLGQIRERLGLFTAQPSQGDLP